MKTQDFNQLLKSVDEARAIRAGKRKPSRVITFNPVEVKTTHPPRRYRKLRTLNSL